MQHCPNMTSTSLENRSFANVTVAAAGTESERTSTVSASERLRADVIVKVAERPKRTAAATHDQRAFTKQPRLDTETEEPEDNSATQVVNAQKAAYAVNQSTSAPPASSFTTPAPVMAHVFSTVALAPVTWIQVAPWMAIPTLTTPSASSNLIIHVSQPSNLNPWLCPPHTPFLRPGYPVYPAPVPIQHSTLPGWAGHPCTTTSASPVSACVDAAPTSAVSAHGEFETLGAGK